MAVSHKFHPHLAHDSLSTRSFLHSLRAMVNKSPLVQLHDRKAVRLARLAKKCHTRTNGWNSFFQGIVHEAQSQLGLGKSLSKVVCSELVVASHKKSAALPAAEKAHFDGRAREGAKRKQSEHQSELEFVEGEFELQGRRLIE